MKKKKFDVYKKKLVDRIENEINNTKTGGLRNLLCDVNIFIQSKNHAVK